MTQTLWIPGPLPGQNDLLASAKGYGGRGRGYSVLKRKWTDLVAWYARAAGLTHMSRARVDFLWSERDRRRDPDGFTSGGTKAILDGLVRASILPDDGWDEIAGFTHAWQVDKANPGVLVTLTAV